MALSFIIAAQERRLRYVEIYSTRSDPWGQKYPRVACSQSAVLLPWRPAPPTRSSSPVRRVRLFHRRTSGSTRTRRQHSRKSRFSTPRRTAHSPPAARNGGQGDRGLERTGGEGGREWRNTGGIFRQPNRVGGVGRQFEFGLQ